MTLRNKPLLCMLAIVLVGLAVDVGTKMWAQNTLLNERFQQRSDDYPVCGNEIEETQRARFVRANATPKEVVPNFFQFRYVENCSSAFNLMANVPESFRFPFFMLISLLALIIIPIMYLKTPPEHNYTLYALPFILSGALGNLIDRMVYRYVIDFIDWYVVLNGKEYHWPTFNIADGAIVVGIGLMLLQLKRQESGADSADDAMPRTGENSTSLRTTASLETNTSTEVGAGGKADKTSNADETDKTNETKEND